MICLRIWVRARCYFIVSTVAFMGHIFLADEGCRANSPLSSGSSQEKRMITRWTTTGHGFSSGCQHRGNKHTTLLPSGLIGILWCGLGSNAQPRTPTPVSVEVVSTLPSDRGLCEAHLHYLRLRLSSRLMRTHNLVQGPQHVPSSQYLSKALPCPQRWASARHALEAIANSQRAVATTKRSWLSATWWLWKAPGVWMRTWHLHKKSTCKEKTCHSLLRYLSKQRKTHPIGATASWPTSAAAPLAIQCLSSQRLPN